MGGQDPAKRQASRRPVYVGAAFAAAVALGIGIVIGRFAICSESDSEPEATKPEVNGLVLNGVPEKLIQDADPEIAEALINSIEAEKIAENLELITRKPHIAGSPADYDLVNILKTKFNESGLDSVKAAPYEVLLSYPDPDTPNSVQLLDGTDGVVFDSVDAEANYSANSTVVRPFNAYSPAGEITTTELVYVNYGRVEDYDYLEKNASVNVTGKIVIARYGKIFRGSKVDIAARHGAVAVILYSDPADYSNGLQDEDNLFPHTWLLPPTAAQRGSIARTTGDPLTPGYPAIRSAYRFSENETEGLPLIPAHPIGYGAAEHFLREMNGQEVPESWRGALNITYKLGPKLNTAGWKVKMSITTKNERKKIHNVIGIIRGAVEPDRYVLIGNHRDAWVNGALDPSSGTAIMMEVARAMAKLVKDGKWRPRRSIVFCSWGGEEYGLIGSTEWVEQYVRTLIARSVAYVNIDIAVEGNATFTAAATPLMYTPLFEAAKKVPNPSEEEKAKGRKTVYDTWIAFYPKNGTTLPEVNALGSGSDHAPLLQIAGITAVDMTYTFNHTEWHLGSYPLYHTEYETFDAVKRLFDPEFKYHQAIARIGGEILRSLADSFIIPFNVSDYAEGLKELKETLDNDKKYGRTFLERNITNYNDLDAAIEQFRQDVKNFEAAVANINRKDPMAARAVNDQLSLLEKAFLDSEGLPQRKHKKHLIFAENANNLYAGSSFPGLADLLFKIDELSGDEAEKRWEEVRHHFSVIVNAIQSAGYSLRDVINFVEDDYDKV